ncbi:hypothetical protein [Salipiger bermudensis]|uniref:Uncharacterized protein n=1 Tax=Salipiger bermudensis (strain DSM 26914 / JCM 13377 / KCTC 12554 / HTCC2601) TaxID=314265 RepID=Q0FR36_SALBH|nr:hypothetical protein [Salipiger bermudensis]EAU46751.1 hypothetical protein R2601_16560 [Salipiger bermudensis HTCC2601]
MSRKFIAAVLAASLAITTFSAAPARADGKDALKLIGAAGALYLLGNSIAQARERAEDERKKDKRKKEEKARQEAHAKQWRERHENRRDERHDARRTDPPRVVGPAFGQRRDAQYVLPARCMMRIEGGGSRYAFDRDCMTNAGVRTSRLPDACEMYVRDGGRKERAFDGACLRRNGYGLEAVRQSGPNLPRPYRRQY